MRFPTIVLALVALALPATAVAAPRALPPIDKDLVAAKASKRTCGARLLSANRRGIDRAAYRAPMSGYLNVRMSGRRRTDWDLAVFDRASGRRLGSSHAFRSTELVQAWVTSGQELTLQGCRRSGRSRRAALEIQLIDLVPPTRLAKPSLVRVKLGSEEDLHGLEETGLDVTHNVREGFADVVLNTVADRRTLEHTGFEWRTRIADLAQSYHQARLADLRYAQRLHGARNLPSGNRTTYRELVDYENELKALAEQYPHVKPVTLPGETIEGREMGGVEIAANVKREEDGRPVYFVVGVHHAREWPAGEAPLEFAYHLAQGYGTDPHITELLDKVRVVIVPILNKDGFHASREASKAYSPRDMCDRETDYAGFCNNFETVEGVPLGGSAAYRRKNCRGIAFPVGTPCELQNGVDPNRNYGEGWGGIGASMNPYAQTYRGTGPWSEPETKAVHEYTQRRQVTNLITIHNVAALVLRPPGRRADGLAPDEPRLKELGNQMAEAAGYTSQYGWQLYDTSGTTEDWNYAAAGTFGYTIEMGPEDGWFHQAYQIGVVDEWNGTGPREGRGLREALMLSLESAANPADHGLITGTAPAGRVLRVRKDFVTETSDVCQVAADEPFVDRCEARSGVREIPDFLESTMTVPASGAFQWHVTPSTRPFVGWKRELGPTVSRRTDTFGPGDEGPKTPRVITELTEEESGGQLDDSSYIREFDVTPEDEAGKLRLALTWPGNAEDYDLRLYFKEADGTLRPIGNGTGGYLPNGTQIFNGSGGSSGNPPGFSEAIEVLDPPTGTYVAKVVSYAATGAQWELKVERLFKEPDIVTDLGEREAWTLTCESADGQTVYDTRQVFVERGQSVSLSLPCGGKAKKPKPPKGPRR